MFLAAQPWNLLVGATGGAMDLQQINLPDPAITPHTWNLQRDIERYAKGSRVIRHAKNTPDIVCSSGHQLIVNTTLTLVSLGAPGMDFQEDWSGDELYEVVSRGSTSPNIFAAFLPQIGRYILYLWLIRAFVESGFKDWRIGKGIFGVTESNAYPTIDCPALAVEWFWVSEYIVLAVGLAEPELDAIPAFWTGGRREDVIAHSTWQEKRLAAMQGQQYLPYRLTLDISKDEQPIILAECQGKELYARLIITMAAFEQAIRQTIEQMILPVWQTLWPATSV